MMMFGIPIVEIDKVLAALTNRGNAQGNGKRETFSELFAQRPRTLERHFLILFSDDDRPGMSGGKQHRKAAINLHDGIHHPAKLPSQVSAVIEQPVGIRPLHIVHPKADHAVFSLQTGKLIPLQQRHQLFRFS